MPRIRQHNITAAQLEPQRRRARARSTSPQPSNYPFGENVFSAAVQRQRLPKETYRRLQRVLEQGEALDTSLADAVALAMKEWALEQGATHYTHVFQPLTGLTAEKHDSFFGPAGDGVALAEFSGKELIQGEPDARRSRPAACARPSRRAATRPGTRRSPAFILENPNGALLCIPTAFASWTGEALDAKIPLLRSMDALSRSRDPRAAAARRRDRHARVHHGRARAGVLPDRRAVLLRAPRPDQHRPHAVRRQAAEGPRARRPLLRLDPRARARLHDGHASSSWPSSACRSRRATTRWRRRSTRSRRCSRTRTSAPTTSS